MKPKYLLVLSKVTFSISVGDFVGYPPSQVTLSVKGLVANSRGEILVTLKKYIWPNYTSPT